MSYEEELDIYFYRETYSDLSELSDSQLRQHWLKNGKEEGRLPNGQGLGEQLNFKLDLDFYLKFYPDLEKSGILTQNQAKLHWLQYGKNEGRFRSFDEVEKETGLRLFYNPLDLDIESILEKNKALNVTFRDLFETLVGNIGKPISVLDDEVGDAKFYRELGRLIYSEFKEKTEELADKKVELAENDEEIEKLHQRVNHLLQAARSSWKQSLYFNINLGALELIGDSFFYEEDYENAKAYYDQVVRISRETNQALMERINRCYEKTKELLNEFEGLVEKLFGDRSLTNLEDDLDHCIQEIYKAHKGRFEIYAMNDDRKLLKDKAYQLSKSIYSTWLNFFGVGDPSLKENLNTKRILIIGDYSITQCVRYRIDQKVEQLESQGKIVTTLDWCKIEDNWNTIAQHDVVIFYRLQALPQVLKAMAMVNANGKASFYEIDDLLFDLSYPDSIETYGGYVGLEAYYSLKKSMVGFYAAARHCRFGISSTMSLCEKLKELVFGSECILHRNGLDNKSLVRTSQKDEEATINIFYGSGTQAHNSDFLEEAFPALKRILKKYPRVRLIVAGYLILPLDFLSEFKKQLIQIPPLNNIQAYWAFLSRGDINLAVLNDNMMNGCKSEIKWLEAACLGIPSVVSSTINYRDVLTDGEDVLLASNEEQWFESLESFIKDRSSRERIGEKAMSKALAEYSIESLGQSLVSNIDKVLNVQKKKNKKKVAIVNVFFPPQAIGGATRVVIDNLEVLEQQYGEEFEVVVFTSDNHERVPHKLSVYQYKGVTIYRATVLRRDDIDWHYRDDVMGDLFRKFIELEEPDLIHFHCVQRLTASVVLAAKEERIPYMITIHDAWWISDHQFLVDAHHHVYRDGHPDILESRSLPYGISLGDSVGRLLFLKELLQGAKTLLTVSEKFADIYRKNGIEDILVNKNGLGSSVKWKPKDTSYSERVICGHVGGMTYHKGYELLKTAIDVSQPQYIELLIVDHSKDPGYKLKSKWGDVPVTFIGRVHQHEVSGLYEKMDVLFAPSMWPESFGLVTREAAACGCWIVASDMGGIGEDIVPGKTGFVIRPELEELKCCISEIDNDVTRYKGLSFTGKVRGVEEQVSELVKIYHE